MERDDMVNGDGWISDESSFYGDEEEQDRLLDLEDDINPSSFWAAQSKDLNYILAQANARERTDTSAAQNNVDSLTHKPSLVEDTKPKLPLKINNNLSGMPGLDRKAMETERLARLGKQMPDMSLTTQHVSSCNAAVPTPKPSITRADYQFSWQPGEPVDDFIRRVPPLTTSSSYCEWIWADSPHRNLSMDGFVPRIQEFRHQGLELLDESRRQRENIRRQNLHGPKVTLNRLLNRESKLLEEHIKDLAVRHNVLPGKWMLFPKRLDVTRVWELIVQGVINDRFGPTAKVAPEDGGEERLICIYTRDFRDEVDVRRVLEEIEAIGLLDSNRSIYYKTDAYTYLGIYGGTASDFGLQASLYNSRKMLIG